MPEWITAIDAAYVLAFAGAALAAYRWHVLAQRDIADLRKRIADNEAHDAEREKRTQEQIEAALKHERELAASALARHEQRDDSILAELRDLKASTERNFARVYSILDDLRDLRKAKHD